MSSRADECYEVRCVEALMRQVLFGTYVFYYSVRIGTVAGGAGAVLHFLFGDSYGYCTTKIIITASMVQIAVF